MDKTYKIRTVFIFFVFCIFFTIGIFNLYTLQITKHLFFKNLAHQQYFITVTTQPPRALILDRNGIPLAQNKEVLSAFMLPRTLKNKPELKKFLHLYFPEAAQRLEKKAGQHFLFIKRNVTETEKMLIEQSGLSDIQFLTEQGRLYPHESTGTIVGLTDIDNHGIFGVELQCEKQLSGQPSTMILEKDARSGRFYFSKQTIKEGTLGTPVQLTIDSNLQFLVTEELRETIAKCGSVEGAAIIMNPDTGEILAMVAFPIFNPNDTHTIDQSLTKNTAITETYEFGSVIKTFCALAALEEKVVTPEEEIDCMGVKTAYVEGRRINTVHELGKAPFIDVIADSNNIGIAKIAMRLGPKLYDHYRLMGFGSKTGVPFPGEQGGFVMPPARWSAQSIISLSYGYEITSTLLQLARIFCIFTNDGHLITPKLFSDQITPAPKKIYSTATIDIMRMILEKTTTKGTARYAHVKGYKTLGKTGTSNLLENGMYNPNKNLFSFTGIIEKDNYKRVISCFVREAKRHDVYAATITAPLFERIAEKMLLHDHIL